MAQATNANPDNVQFSNARSTNAPGQPGISPTWSSSAKDMVSTALGSGRIWATFGFGIVNEVYWPSTGSPQIRDLGFIVAGPNGWTEVKRAQRYTISTPKPSVPLVRAVHIGEDYRLTLEFLPHPLRDVLLVRYQLEGKGQKLYALLAPHLNGARHNNTAHASHELSAWHEETALCLCASEGFSRSSAGYVGTSDGWQDFNANGQMSWQYENAHDGNVALTGELKGQSGVLALGFAPTPEGAHTLASSSLAEDYDSLREEFINRWADWAKTLFIPYANAEQRQEAERSAAVLKVHEDRTYAGAMVASLSVPWGSAHDDPGGYHLVWTRDTVEAAFALITVGQVEDAARTLAYLAGTQGDDGSWAQNYFPDGRGYWRGRQLDEVALPVLLGAKLKGMGEMLDAAQVERMSRRAIGFIVRHGPLSDQDRWEENEGASPFTLAITIAALVEAADLFDAPTRDYLYGLADGWNEQIESLTYAFEGPLTKTYGGRGYYVRLGARPEKGGVDGVIPVKNVAGGATPANRLVGLEFLQLVRMGLRAPNDPRIRDTLNIVDQMLRVETPTGPAYHRYNGDGYGEHADGAPFDGTGIGRLWPLLTGERGHYAIAHGEDGLDYLEAMTRMTGPGGLIPEQVWDTDPIPERNLFPGRPSGSAMPLLWAHAEYLKLLATHAEGRPCELLPGVEARYRGERPRAGHWHWRIHAPFGQMPRQRDLLIELAEPFVLHFGFNNWAEPLQISAVPTHFGLFGAQIAKKQLSDAKSIDFTFFYPGGERWEGRDFHIELIDEAELA